MQNDKDESVDEVVLRWFGHVGSIEKERFAKKVYVGECVGSRSLGRPRKRWIDTMKVCLKQGRGTGLK